MTPPTSPAPLAAPVLRPGRNCHDLPWCEDSGLLIDGRAYYTAFYRAALRAERYLLMSGWQFDQDTQLLSGEPAKLEPEVRLVPFLQRLCEGRPHLRIYMLAWDFSVAFALERQWFQRLRFDWTTHERLSFRFDSNHPIGASHHHKVVVVDGRIGFVGGMDICSNRWDDREHREKSDERVNPRGEGYGPSHDIQGVVTGPVVATLRDFFRERWLASGGPELELVEPPTAGEPLALTSSVRLGPARVGLSRTLGAGVSPPQPTVREVRQLYVDAVQSAEQLVYIENQYVTSVALRAALARRLRDPRRGKLDLVFVLPTQPEYAKEAVAIGEQQAQWLLSMQALARQHGHAMGVYCTTPAGAKTGQSATFIHAKLMIVDDRLLTMGTANTTNRSFGLDSEINLTWEASDDAPRLHRAIRRARLSLLAEHTGARTLRELRALARPGGLVARLDASIAAGQGRLFHRQTTSEGPLTAFNDLASALMDPEQALVEEDLFEALHGLL